MGFIEEIEKEISINDFAEGSVLRFIAEHDTSLALRVAVQFGGDKHRIQKFETVTKSSQRKIVSRETAQH